MTSFPFRPVLFRSDMTSVLAYEATRRVLHLNWGPDVSGLATDIESKSVPADIELPLTLAWWETACTEDRNQMPFPCAGCLTLYWTRRPRHLTVADDTFAANERAYAQDHASDKMTVFFHSLPSKGWVEYNLHHPIPLHGDLANGLATQQGTA